MSDLKPSELTAEERALWDAIMVREQKYIGPDDECPYSKVDWWAEKCILARRLLFAPPASKERKCSNCLAPSDDHELCARCEAIMKGKPAPPASEEKVTCECGKFECWECRNRPAQPEPAATEMPNEIPTVYPNQLDQRYRTTPGDRKEPVAITEACRALNKENYLTFELTLKTWWVFYSREVEFALNAMTAKYDNEKFLRERDHIAQPVTPPLAMSEELERVLYAAEERSIQLDETMLGGARAVSIRAAIQKVRAQATATKMVKMVVVRSVLEKLLSEHPHPEMKRNPEIVAALAELDAHEGRKP